MDIRTAHFEASLPGGLGQKVDDALNGLAGDRIIPRIWAKDWTVWKPVDREITGRLGWLDAAESAAETLSELEAFAGELRSEGFRKAVLLGMGGSSLAAEVFGGMSPLPAGGIDLEVLDTTAPESVLEVAGRVDFETTLFIVSSKSGTTAELNALLCFFYDLALGRLGEGRAGSRFVAVTDPGTPLERSSETLRFRRVFQGLPDVGGRFSALTPFGLVPAALAGIDLNRLLASAAAMARECRGETPAANPGAVLGAVIGLSALEGRDKLTLLVPRELRPLAAWLEQLVAESTGKEGRGILPVIENLPVVRADYGSDRLFVEFLGPARPFPSPDRTSLLPPGSPVIQIPLRDLHSLGAQFFLWEMATAVAGRFLGINPFDQPDVDATKTKTREILAGRKPGAPPAPESPALTADGIRVYMREKPSDLDLVLRHFVGQARQGDYLTVQAFLAPSADTLTRVEGFADRIRGVVPVPVTVGFGPRFLHSTGQLHKGDRGNGLFVQLAAAGHPDAPIPGIPGIARPAESFGDLFAAQSWGDWMALRDRGRRVVRFEFEGPVAAGITRLSGTL